MGINEGDGGRCAKRFEERREQIEERRDGEETNVRK